MLTVVQLQRLRAEMFFPDVWSWAGCCRTTTKLGIAWTAIPVAVRNLVDDAPCGCRPAGRDTNTDEAAVALHHRLTQIHPFVNGNGRHARLAADEGEPQPLVAFARS